MRGFSSGQILKFTSLLSQSSFIHSGVNSYSHMMTLFAPLHSQEAQQRQSASRQNKLREMLESAEQRMAQRNEYGKFIEEVVK